MRSLFLKIFAWFWLTSALVVAAGVVVAFTFPHAWPGPPRAFDDANAALAVAAADVVDREGLVGLRPWLERVERSGHFRLYAFDGRGNPLDGRVAPPPVRRLAEEGGPDGTPPGRLEGPELIVVSRTTGSGGRQVQLVAVETLGPRPEILFDQPWLLLTRLFAVVVTAGLVCFGLAKYLASPIVKLRAATAQFARGDLGTRVGPSLGRRKDELASLGQDFDFMAGRIQSLVTAQQTLLRDISHELRSPLARLNVALELARRRSSPDASAALDRMERESERLNEMIGQLLTLTRLETESDGMADGRVNLAELVSSVASDADFEAHATNRSVKCIRLDDCSLIGNATLLRSAVENVVRNAVGYTHDGTAVEIELCCDGDEAVVAVRDHGDGVPREALEEIFRPFYRVADARDRRSGGTGLGLAITQRAARIHGGMVLARNAQDGGLVVEIRIPKSSV